MVRAILRKELVETSFVAVFAILALLTTLGCDLWSWSDDDRWRHPGLLSIDTVIAFFVICPLLAGLLGLNQTVLESVQGTWGYFLHLPLTRRQLISAKLAWGLFLLSSCGLPFIALCAFTAAGRARLETPLEWWMIDPFFRVLFSSVVIYLAAFLSGLRLARWYGSRLLPLAGAVFVWLMLLYMPNWWLIIPWILLVYGAVCVRCIFQIADTRDYQ